MRLEGGSDPESAPAARRFPDETMIARRLLVLPLFAALGACHGATAPRELEPRPPSAVAAADALVERAPLGPSREAPSPAPAAEPGPSEAAPGFAGLVGSLSEPDATFFSDNYISNETSYLDVASSLQRETAKGGAYVGVGPEQNFTYIAMVRPKLAFIVDIRRQNMLLHLLYKAIFDEATSRSHFLCLLTGRPYDATSAPPDAAGLDAVIAHAESHAPSGPTFAESHARLLERIQGAYGVRVDAADKISLERAHRAFFDKQLDLRFELKKANGRAYPSLRELFTERDPAGKQLGFLADEGAFRFVQTMEREHRVIPVVGDVAGDRAMPGIAEHLKAQGLVLSALYISNVEQYLFEPKVWSKWSRNVAALPTDDKSLFIRAYLDQGKRHPRQRTGHRTATLLQRVADFEAHEQKHPYTSFWALATDGI